MRIKNNASWRISVPHARVSSTWRKASQAWVKVNGVWREYYLELSIGVASASSTVIDSLETRYSVTLALAGTYGGSVTCSQIGGSSSIGVSKSSDSQWTFYALGTPGTVSGSFRFTYTNGLETVYKDVSVTVKSDPPPPPPPPPTTTTTTPPPSGTTLPPPPPPGGPSISVVINWRGWSDLFNRMLTYTRYTITGGTSPYKVSVEKVSGGGVYVFTNTTNFDQRGRSYATNQHGGGNDYSDFKFTVTDANGLTGSFVITVDVKKWP